MPALRSKTEINLIRLLARCEVKAAENVKGDWRLEQYVECLETYLEDLQKETQRKPSEETLKEYSKKIAFLKDFLSTKTLSTAAEKAFANQMLIPSDKQTIPSLVASPTGKQIKQNAAIQYRSQMKKELFSKSDDSTNSDQNNLRKRKIRNVDEELEHHEQVHENIAEEIISLTRNLRHNITVSGNIIREDTKVMQQSAKNADSNISQLQHESSRLEAHLRKGTNWWLWISLAIVCATFFTMIVFIRFFPKPR
uniref:vesicle transport protein USE1-like n=1 Tax=Ciona intestinalis TaxID=7719 RepID=UPI000052184E|nr:vesicle transport protein USE1-like [Ciona intestinalis]|eukprot:XP_002122322.1 vesicle transport protein USE1-like [Ciona intestinalis]